MNFNICEIKDRNKEKKFRSKYKWQKKSKTKI